MVLGLIWGFLTLPFKFWGLIVATLSFSVGVVFPLLESFKAIESKDPQDDKQWLMYWVVVSSLLVIEKFAWPVLMWIPLYSLLRLALLGWLAAPQFHGASLAYDLLRPLLMVAVKRSAELPALDRVPTLQKYVRSYQKAFGEAASRTVAPTASTATSTAPAAMPHAVQTPELTKAAEAQAQPAEETFQATKTHAN